MADWNVGRWGTDRWGTLALADLLQQPPQTSGRPTGVGDWCLAIEMLVPAPDAGLWGLGRWGTAEWGSFGWIDLTDRARGLSWTRGSDEVYGRPRVGSIALTLDDADGYLDPWTSEIGAYCAPGTVVRAGLVSASGWVDPGDGGPGATYGTIRWVPLWTGIVGSWTPLVSTSKLNDRYVALTLNETLRDLAQVDDPALGSLVGGGEGAAARVQRLLDAANWRYGYLLEAQNLIANPATSTPVQSTDMAQNRLSELYLTADSSDTAFRSLRDGRAGLTASEYVTAVSNADPAAQPMVQFSWVRKSARRSPFLRLGATDRTFTGGLISTLQVAYRPETFRSQAQDTEISNAVSLSVVGDPNVYSFTQVASVERFGQRSYVRRDLINTIPSAGSYLTQLSRYISIRRALTTLRLEALTIDTWTKPEPFFLAVISLEPGDETAVLPILGGSPGAPAELRGLTAQITHRITPRVPGSSMVWETDVRIDTRQIYNVRGAQLPSTP